MKTQERRIEARSADTYVILPGRANSGLVLLCDHAGNAFPPEYGTLGLPDSQLKRHIAYDIGAAEVTRRLSVALGAPAVMTRYSRLLIDPNRGEDDPTLIRQLYDRTVISGNYPLTEGERRLRLERWYRPYHEAIGRELQRIEAASGRSAFLVSLHSFTPNMQGGALRPWHVSLLWDRDDRARNLLHEHLAADPALTVGDNEPYDGALAGDTLSVHGTAAGRAHVLIEIRQDLIESADGQRQWGKRLAAALDAINRRPDMHEIRYFGSRTSA